MAVVTDNQLAMIETEKARVTTELAGGLLGNVAALLGKPASVDLSFGNPLLREGLAVVTVFQSNGTGEVVPIGYIEATDTTATFRKTTISDIPEILLLAGAFILPILLLVFLVRGLSLLGKRNEA